MAGDLRGKHVGESLLRIPAGKHFFTQAFAEVAAHGPAPQAVLRLEAVAEGDQARVAERIDRPEAAPQQVRRLAYRGEQGGYGHRAGRGVERANRPGGL